MKVLVPKTPEDPLRRMLLFPRARLVVEESTVDHRDERIKLRPGRRLYAHVTRRRRELHYSWRPCEVRFQTVAPPRDGSPALSEPRSEHDHEAPGRPNAKRYLLPNYCSGAYTGAGWCFRPMAGVAAILTPHERLLGVGRAKINTIFQRIPAVDDDSSPFGQRPTTALSKRGAVRSYFMRRRTLLRCRYTGRVTVCRTSLTRGTRCDVCEAISRTCRCWRSDRRCIALCDQHMLIGARFYRRLMDRVRAQASGPKIRGRFYLGRPRHRMPLSILRRLRE